MPSDAAIGQVFAPYRPGGRHGHRFWLKKIVWHCETAVLKLAFKRHETDPLLIKATSCEERSNAMGQAEELSYLSSHQTLPTDKNWCSY
jgi:hypothetical protein